MTTSTEIELPELPQDTDVYDPDRIAADLELIRRYYLKNGYADFRVVSTDVQFDAARGGYIVTIAVEEGQQYRVGAVNVESRIPRNRPRDVLRRQHRDLGRRGLQRRGGREVAHRT